MAETESSFEIDRLNAAREFAQTMIVVDDEAGDPPLDDVPARSLSKPTRKDAKAAPKAKFQEEGHTRHPLDQKALIDRALDLGLVCAVVRPEKGEGVARKVANAAERADIVSLDWEIHDKGETAKSIINEIVKRDEKYGGRLRLIAIYTGVNDRDKIYSEIFKALPDSIKDARNIRQESDQIVSDAGLRIVWLFKAGGTQLRGNLGKFQVAEGALAERLQSEFSALSKGLLSNVALATIAAVRDSTHHVLAKFTGDMDGPYFHHRAFLKYPVDAQDYAVSVVLSELKSAVDKTEVASKHAGKAAIGNRIGNLIADGADLKLHYASSKNDPIDYQFSKEDVLGLVHNGWSSQGDEFGPKKAGVGVKNVRVNFSSLFENSRETGRQAMMAFASLTGVRSHPGSYLYGKSPQLVLGTVIHSSKTGYLLCLQASCDVVRITGNHEFYFVRLTENRDKPDHVVPVVNDSGNVDYLGLDLVDSAYAKSVSLTFAPNGVDADDTIRAQTTSGRKGYYFEAVNNERYTWIANLKERRAMRSAQWVGNEMGRIGFDEFEPFRPDPKPEK